MVGIRDETLIARIDDPIQIFERNLPDDISLQQIVENLELLAMQLNGDTQEDIDAAWEAEINERVRQYKAGETQSFDGEEVLAEARRLCKK